MSAKYPFDLAMDSSTTVAREAQSVDDDGVFTLAKEAALFFQARKYAESLQLLKKPADLKVAILIKCSQPI